MGGLDTLLFWVVSSESVCILALAREFSRSQHIFPPTHPLVSAETVCNLSVCQHN